MALAQLSAPFSSLKGKVGGTIYQSYRGATMVKTRTPGGGVKSERWQASKNCLGTLASGWRALPAASQAAWAAAAPSFPYIDKFGNPQIPSGYQLYITLNVPLFCRGLPILLVPPAPGIKVNITGLALAIPDVNTMNVTWTTPNAAGYRLVFYMSNMISKGITNPPTRWREVTNRGAAIAQPLNLAADYASAFGKVSASGRYWLKVDVVIIATGELYGTTFIFADL